MESSPSRGSGVVPLVLAILVLVPILYVLSIGPVVAVLKKTGTGEEAVLVFYAPVIWLHENTPLKEPLEKYGELWGWH